MTGRDHGGGSIVVCGEALVDLIAARSGDEVGYAPRPGGSPYNVAVALARLDVPTAFLGRISTDIFGERLRDHLASNGVDLRYVRRGPEPTTLAFVHVEEGQEPTYAFYRDGTADRALSPEDVPSAFPDGVRALHVGLGSITLAVEPAASTLRSLMEREREPGSSRSTRTCGPSSSGAAERTSSCSRSGSGSSTSRR